MQNSVNYIIYTPGYDEQVGGKIVLHQLCHLLRTLGVQAYLWPHHTPRWHPKCLTHAAYDYSIQRINQLRGKTFQQSEHFTTPLATPQHLKKSIVIYPDLIRGNPLGAQKVVRWFLYLPKKRYQETPNQELHFYFQQTFYTGKTPFQSHQKLMIVTVLDHIYQQTNFEKRSGNCYILRKGKHRNIHHDLSNGMIIDGLPHEKVAEIFNQVEYCISYDLHTMYVIYAALCGCKPLIVPDQAISREAWQPIESMRYGLAYGEQDLEHAIKTRPNLIENIKRIEAANLESVQHFISRCEAYFTFE